MRNKDNKNKINEHMCVGKFIHNRQRKIGYCQFCSMAITDLYFKNRNLKKDALVC